METSATKLLKCAAICGLCGVACAGVALAGPPAGHEGMMARVAGQAHGGRAGSSFNSFKIGMGHLDLRAPTDVPQAAANAGAPVGFPSSRHLAGSTADSLQLPALGRDGHLREMSRVEEFARRVHREGLPIARLWESHSALVSLGLNQRGKPGIWLIQKVH
jgi:hypothetical protein